MVPLMLLLLLLPNCLAEQVCITFNSSSINITVSNATINEEPLNSVNCSNEGYSCFFDCMYGNFPYHESWFNASSVCLEAQVEKFAKGIAYTLQTGRGSTITCILYLCLNDTILEIMESLDNTQEGMLKLFYLRDSCFDLFETDLGIKKEFLKLEKIMIHQVMETAIYNHSYDLKNLYLNVINIRNDELDITDPRVKVKDAELLPGNCFSPEIWLPVYALDKIPQKKRSIGLVSYTGHSQFQFDKDNFTSMIIRIELLGDKRLNDLSIPLQIIFTNMSNTTLNNTQIQCRYFDEKDWKWEPHGCETDITETDVICSCSHTTAFSVLLINQEISPRHWKILSYISYIGCGLSAFFTALSIIIYIFGRSSRTDHSISIHVSLSGSLFLLNTTFMLTEWGATVDEEWVCVFVAAFMHYCLLCCFTWMAIEALHLYLMLIKVFNTHFKHYMLKLSLAGWGIPCIIVGVSLAVKQNQFYGLTEMTMLDSNQTNAICWITDDSYFYSVNLVYFTLIFIFNSSILVAVASSICKMKQVLRHNLKAGAEAEKNPWMNPNRFSDSCKSGLTVMGITFLMGTTWGLAFLGSGYVNYFILYLFCILNSTQGFFIFLWICLSTKRQRKRDYEDRMTSTPMKTSATKSD